MQKEVLRSMTARRVMVQLENGWSVTGTLERVTTDELLISGEVVFLDPSAGRHPADGESVIDRRRVFWVQVS